MAADEPENAGDLGEDCAPSLSDTRMQERAIRERWPMSASVRVKVLKRLCKIVDEDADHGDLPPPGYREIISASRALLAADKLNLEQEKLDLVRKLREGEEPEVDPIKELLDRE